MCKFERKEFEYKEIEIDAVLVQEKNQYPKRASVLRNKKKRFKKQNIMWKEESVKALKKRTLNIKNKKIEITVIIINFKCFKNKTR